MRYHIALCASLALCYFSACTKHDHCPEPPNTGTGCGLAQSLVTYLTDHPYTRTQYEKEFDKNGKIIKVKAGLFGVGLQSTRVFQLQYKGETVYFLDENSHDTVLIAHFDDAGRLQEIIQAPGRTQNAFLPVLFTYNASRLAHIQIIADRTEGTSLFTKYDIKGNIIELSDSTDLNFSGFTYTYDLSVTATQQFYSDDFYDTRYNTLYLAEFLDWLPDLEPVNKRIGSGMFGNPEIPLINHLYDSEGRLVSYESGQEFSSYQLKFTNVWNCNGKKEASMN